MTAARQANLEIHTATTQRLPGAIFEELTLPRMAGTLRDSNDPSHNYTGGGSSSYQINTNPPEPALHITRSPAPVTYIKGVIIHSDGVLSKETPHRFAPIIVSSIDFIFHTNDTPCSIPSLIGLPIWMRYDHHDPATDTFNPFATWLHIIGATDSESFGFVKKMWHGSAVVVRTDGKSLLPGHLEVLVSFCKDLFQKVLGDDLGSVGLSEDAGVREKQVKTFHKLASPRTFLHYFMSYCSKRAVADQLWRDLPLPYDQEYLDSMKLKSEYGHNEEPRRSGRPTRVPTRMLEMSYGE
ncbi:hypothetical protein ACLMJK_005182 [Lecanora helva]